MNTNSFTCFFWVWLPNVSEWTIFWIGYSVIQEGDIKILFQTGFLLLFQNCIPVNEHHERQMYAAAIFYQLICILYQVVISINLIKLEK